MKKTKVFYFIFLHLFLMSQLCSGQEQVMKGRVYTFDSIPLINASVQVKSTKQVVKTDTLGNFYAACNYEDVLKVSANGFSNVRVKLNPKIKLVVVNLKLKAGEKNREMAIGYGHVKDADRVFAVANMSSNDFDFSQYTTIYELIQGRFPGVYVSNGEIIIRGQSSLYASSAALIVVDGVAVDNSVLFSIAPIDVKSIDVIKDSGSAIYGSRGANGVLLIETKRGKIN